MLIGLFAFVGFFATLALTIAAHGIAFAFTAATLVALALQGVSLGVMQRR